LEPWEAVEMNFDVEEFEQGETKDGEDRQRPVANYVREYDDAHGEGCRPAASNSTR
jgi:hypothetical protein